MGIQGRTRKKENTKIKMTKTEFFSNLETPRCVFFFFDYFILFYSNKKTNNLRKFYGI